METLMAYEEESLGFRLTHHPLRPWRQEIRRLGLTSLGEAGGFLPGASLSVAALIVEKEEGVNKRGKAWRRMTIEDETGRAVCFCFGDAYKTLQNKLDLDVPMVLYCKLFQDEGESAGRHDENTLKLVCEAAVPLAQACASRMDPLTLTMRNGPDCPAQVARLKAILPRYGGNVPVHVVLHLDDSWARMELSPEYSVTPGPELYTELAQWLE
jgi:DNA polymerase-3 subunit alpha